MALTSQQLTYLRTADQRFRAVVSVFPVYSPTITPPDATDSGTELTPCPIPMVSPRLSVVDHSGEMTLYATDSYNRGGEYVGDGNIAWENTGEAGSLVDNEDGTATYTAPAEGSGTNLITMTATNGNGSKGAKCYVAYPKSTYDAIVGEIVTLTGSLGQHGWKLLMRVRGDASAFTLGAAVLLHVEDTWDGTTSTFGGYKYSEGVFVGYITEWQYYEDWSEETWLAVEVSSPWAKMQRIQLGETYWGKSAAGGRFWLPDFKPVDALWHLLNEVTDFTSRHNVTIFSDENEIDDFIIGKGPDERADLATIVEDVAGRTLVLAFCDRYGSLMIIPDPDIRADEWWGTPSPVYDASGDGGLTQDYSTNYTITRHMFPRVAKLTLAAYDSNKLGIFGASQSSAGSLGTERTIRGLLCDDAETLGAWAVQKRAALNRRWEINANFPLNHTVDLVNFVDANYTSPSQTNGGTASGSAWIESISYRPDIPNGGWQGNIRMLQRTEGEGEAETGAISSFGGTGVYFTSQSASGAPTQWKTGSSGWSSAICSWWVYFNVAAGSWCPSALTSGEWYKIVVSGTGVYGPPYNYHADPQHNTKDEGTSWNWFPRIVFNQDGYMYEGWTASAETAQYGKLTAHSYTFKRKMSSTAFRIAFPDNSGDHPLNSGRWRAWIYTM